MCDRWMRLAPSRSSLRGLVHYARLNTAANEHRRRQRLRGLTNKGRVLRGTPVSLCLNLGRVWAWYVRLP